MNRKVKEQQLGLDDPGVEVITMMVAANSRRFGYSIVNGNQFQNSMDKHYQQLLDGDRLLIISTISGISLG